MSDDWVHEIKSEIGCVYLDKVKARLEELRSVRLDKILPCTEEEVSILAVVC